MKSTVLRLLGRPHNERLENVLQSVAGNGKGKAALLEALLRARARGLGAAAGEVDEDEFVIAGVLDRDGDLEGIEVIVVEDQLAKDPAPIAKGQTNPDGEFCVRFKAKSAPIVRVFARHGRDRWVTPPRRVEKETWVEWSRGGGQPVPRPGTFELREALLNEVVGAAGLKLEELDETPRGCRSPSSPRPSGCRGATWRFTRSVPASSRGTRSRGPRSSPCSAAPSTMAVGPRRPPPRLSMDR